MEHRFGRRFAVFESVRLRALAGEVTEAALMEISLSGARLRTSVRWPMMCPLHVLLPPAEDSRGSATVVAARVIRHADDGIAVEWLDLAPLPVQVRLRGRS